MFAKIIDSQGQLVTVVYWQIVTLEDGQILDRFIDSNDNLYLERPHNDLFNEIDMNYLVIGVQNFYQIQGFTIQQGRLID